MNDEFKQSMTYRATVPALEEMLYKQHKVLDHGFVRLIDYMGDDAAIVQAARVSYGKGTKTVNGDAGLINYLMRNRHSTPFEMCSAKFHVKLPIFIARQWIRHRTASVNEISARYSVLDREFYLPEPHLIASQSKSNKQGRGEVLSPEQSAAVLDILRNDAMTTYGHYEEMLNERDGQIIDENKAGVARELARMNLTLNTYTQWYWKCDLHNLLHFLALRGDGHAQYEIREYARVIGDMVAKWVPLAWAAFINHRRDAVTLSANQVNALMVFLQSTAEFNHLGVFDSLNIEISKGELSDLKTLLLGMMK